MIALGLLCLAVMVLAIAAVGWGLSRAPWLWHIVAAVLALAGALVAFGVIAV